MNTDDILCPFHFTCYMINLLARVVGKLVAVLLHEQFLPPVAFPVSTRL